MDLEQRIERLEEEMRHERSLRLLQSQRMDTHDRFFDAIQTHHVETTRILKETAAQMQTLQKIVEDTQQLARETQAEMKQLIEALLRVRQNGGQA